MHVHSQVKIKDIKLCDVYNGDKQFESTLGNIKGTFTIYVTDNNKVYRIEFSPSQNFATTDKNFNPLPNQPKIKKVFENNNNNTLFSSFSLLNDIYKRKIESCDVDRLIKGMELNYGIKFKKTNLYHFQYTPPEYEKGERYVLNAEKYGNIFNCRIIQDDWSQIEATSYLFDKNWNKLRCITGYYFSFSVTNKRLLEVAEQENDQKFNADF